jgi:hypothetical protein
MDNSAPLLNLFITAACHLCGSYRKVNIGVGVRCLNDDSRPHLPGNQLLEAVAAEEAVEPDELEVSFELEELAAGVELSDDLDASLPDLASLLPLAEAGFAEE